MTRPPRDMAASIQARLRNVAKARGHDTQIVLTQFALERLLLRISTSPHGDQFLLKGALLFVAWTGLPHRATRDLDLLGRGPAEEARLLAMFRSICTTEVEQDGITFDPQSVALSRIREDQNYEGWRVTLLATLGTARIDVQVDIGFGDHVHPAAQLMRLPPLLDLPTATILAYPRDTVIAEKLEAMVSLGLLNSRMKDFFDLQFLASHFEFERTQLTTAVRGTFARRQTPLPTTLPIALDDAFAADAGKQVQWRAFLRRTKLATDMSLADVVAELRAFLWPVLTDATPSEKIWPAGGPWQD
ncbi:MAG: hypothetical protein ACI85K_002094 [Hyphomicrobiaceae bacterium]|jgi:hypothetical protein